MQLFQNLSNVELSEPTVLTIGTFDGLHAGHQFIIQQLKAAGRELKAQAAVVAFHPRPKTVFNPAKFSNDYLTTVNERIALFEALGLDVLLIMPFSLALAQTAASDFVRMVVERFKVRQLCVGHDFALGKNREGNVAKLTELGREFNYTLREVEPLLLDGQVVSSTTIRQELSAGNARQATRLLGRYPSLTSHIIQGAQRGHTIGFPTANFFIPPERLIPANGVYATFIRRLGDDRRLPSVTNVGIRPSFGGHDRTVETFIFDFGENIYHQTFTLEFVERLRAEKKFDGIDALIAQIKRDAEQAQALLTAEMVAVA
jgi:riboflavin kinase/FMN adenylyltransferase